MEKRFLCCLNCTSTTGDRKNGFLYICSACGKAPYCSIICQKQQWKDFHKSTCKTIWQSKKLTIDELVGHTYWMLRNGPNTATGAYCTEGLNSYIPRPGVYEGGFYEVNRDICPARHGFGRYIWNKSMWYIGDWDKDRRHGNGKHLMSCGDLYEGSWVADCMHGKGVRIFGNGFRYEGDFYEDYLHGTGTMTAPDCSTWTGTFNMENSMNVNEANWKKRLENGTPLERTYREKHNFQYHDDGGITISTARGCVTETISATKIEKLKKFEEAGMRRF